MTNKIFDFLCWTVIIIAGLLGMFASFCTVGGAVTFVLTLFSTNFATAFSYFAVGFFGSVAALFVIYLLVCAFWSIEKAGKKK